MSKIRRSTKALLLILGLVLISGVFFWWNYTRPKTIKNTAPVTVRELKDATEKALGTIIYPSAGQIPKVEEQNAASQTSFEVPDSIDGVVGIYSQDLLNRYPKNNLTLKSIKRDDSLGGKASVLTSESAGGKLMITAWANKNGFTSIIIQKDKSY